MTKGSYMEKFSEVMQYLTEATVRVSSLEWPW